MSNRGQSRLCLQGSLQHSNASLQLRKVSDRSSGSEPQPSSSSLAGNNPFDKQQLNLKRMTASLRGPFRRHCSTVNGPPVLRRSDARPGSLHGLQRRVQQPAGPQQRRALPGGEGRRTGREWIPVRPDTTLFCFFLRETVANRGPILFWM